MCYSQCGMIAILMRRSCIFLLGGGGTYLFFVLPCMAFSWIDDVWTGLGEEIRS